MKSIFYYILGAVCLSSCLDSSFDTTDLVNYNDVNYLSDGQNYMNYPNDPYHIVGITPYENKWDVIVEYTGGCEEHGFYTWWDGKWSGSESFEARIWLSHDSKGDACERVVRDTLELDLQTLFQSGYPEEGAVVTAINAYNSTRITVDPSFLYIQTENCNLRTSLVGSICGKGIWDNQWLLLNDSTKNPEKIWLQPVKSNLAGGLTIPSSGEYRVQVRLLFGFQYADNDSSCDEPYDNTVIPVSVNCLQKM